ncbi:DUF86 domain-containing protein [Bacteroides sp. 51]|uniref:HepT-like ribonuclease domain-containing protein n=1 Tax=Bacteroides sp. 51 TaxID=2302938 RepID=UPI0013D3C710|nr:HepT-like ribonuclease domain-containing protein [Bacteroides sp. 51]NDV84099.1 DUF86 domain-containing protein [Bacteroides sp. 51]
MFDKELLTPILEKIEFALDRILANSSEIVSPSYYLLTVAGMERLESTCMLLIAIGESIKNIDKITEKKLLPNYPTMDWKGVMGMRDIIAHHYFDIDAETVFDVLKNYLPELKTVIHTIKVDINLLHDERE